MTEEINRPLSNVEGGTPQKSEQPKRSLEDVEAKADASLARRDQINEAEKSTESADRQGQVELFLMENEMFGYEPYSEDVMASLTALLLDVEGKLRRVRPEFDITKDWNEEQVRKYLKRKYDRRELSEEAAEKDEDDRDGYTKAVETVRKNNPNIDNLSLCQKLIAEHEANVPPQHLAKLQTYIQIQNLATTPEDAAIVTAKINALSFDGGIPDPVLFVQNSIFTDPALSENTKDAIATNLSIPRPNITTGSQVDRAMDAVDEAGDPLYTPDNLLPIRDGVGAYVAPDGSRVARVEVRGIGVREMPWERGQSGTVIGLKLSMLKIWAVNEAKGNTDFFGETVNIDTQILSQSDPEKLRKVQQVMEALLGGDAGYDGEIITDEQADFIGWFTQYVATKGDASEGDFDENVADENRINLGFHPGGDTSQLDYEVLRAAGLFAQGQYGSGEPDYYALQRHLHDLFPEKNIPLTGENAPEVT